MRMKLACVPFDGVVRDIGVDSVTSPLCSDSFLPDGVGVGLDFDLETIYYAINKLIVYGEGSTKMLKM